MNLRGVYDDIGVEDEDENDDMKLIHKKDAND